MTEEKYQTVFKDTIQCKGPNGDLEYAMSVSFGLIDLGDKFESPRRYKIPLACPLIHDKSCGGGIPRCHIYKNMKKLEEKIKNNYSISD